MERLILPGRPAPTEPSFGSGIVRASQVGPRRSGQVGRAKWVWPRRQGTHYMSRRFGRAGWAEFATGNSGAKKFGVSLNNPGWYGVKSS